jgi:hypothetical protein
MHISLLFDLKPFYLIFKKKKNLFFKLWLSETKTACNNWLWWYRPVVSALRRLKQEAQELEASLDYITRPCLKRNNSKKPI